MFPFLSFQIFEQQQDQHHREGLSGQSHQPRVAQAQQEQAAASSEKSVLQSENPENIVSI